MSNDALNKPARSRCEAALAIAVEALRPRAFRHPYGWEFTALVKIQKLVPEAVSVDRIAALKGTGE